MRLDKKLMNAKLNQVAKKWDMYGQLAVIKDNDLLYQNYYGFVDRDRQKKTEKDSPYLVDAGKEFFLMLAIFLLVDEGKVKLHHTLDHYIPDFQHGQKIKIIHLLKHESGIKDYFHSMIMVDMENEDVYHQLSHQERIQLESKKYYQSRSFKTVTAMIKDEDLTFEPGIKSWYSDTNYVLMTEIVERVTGMKAVEYLNKELFQPLGMKGVRVTSSIDTLSYRVHNNTELLSVKMEDHIDNIFAITVDDLVLLLNALASRKVFSDKLWKKVTKLDKDGEALLFSNANGFLCASTECLGFEVYLYLNQDTGVSFVTLTNAQQFAKSEGGVRHYFRKDVRNAIMSLTIQPKDTKMVRINKGNIYEAMAISITDEQKEFVPEALSAIAMSSVYRDKKTYVQMEGNLAVGLLVLTIDKKKEHYDISIVIVDEKYQGRGYGKHMVNFAIETLKAAGAKELTIGVNRMNEAAKKVYLHAGFKPDLVFEGGMGLRLKL